MVLIKSNNTVSVVLLLAGAMQIWPACTDKEKPELINGAVLHNYVERFNVEDPEFYVNAIPNERAEVFLKNNITYIRHNNKFITARKMFNASSVDDLPTELQHPCC